MCLKNDQPLVPVGEITTEVSYKIQGTSPRSQKISVLLVADFLSGWIEKKDIGLDQGRVIR